MGTGTLRRIHQRLHRAHSHEQLTLV